MSPVLILCGFPEPMRIALENWCSNRLPGLTIRVLRDTDQLQMYMASQGEFADRNRPVPHVVFSFWARHQNLAPDWDILKRSRDLNRLPVVLIAEGKSREEILPLHLWPLSAVMSLPEDQEITEFFEPVIDYWMKMVQLPLT